VPRFHLASRIIFILSILFLFTACETAANPFLGTPDYTPGPRIAAAASEIEITASLLAADDLDQDGQIGAGDEIILGATVHNTGEDKVNLLKVQLSAVNDTANCSGTQALEPSTIALCTVVYTVSADEAKSGQVVVSFSVDWQVASAGSPETTLSSPVAIPLSAIAVEKPQVTPTPKPTAKPTLKTTPRPTTKPAPAPTVQVITAAYFGPGVIVKYYDIYGSTPDEVDASIIQNSPDQKGLVEAEAFVTGDPAYRFDFQTLGNTCTIVYKATPPIYTTITVTLPHWVQPKGVNNDTIKWVADDFTRVIVHERVHVQHAISATAQANKVLASSTCDNAEANLNQVWYQMNVSDCQFDLDEYAAAEGYTMKQCLAGQF
jgi:predicted secreted Zn-dependent protease